MRVTIHGTELPGRTCGEWQDIRIGIQVGRDAADLVLADARSVTFSADVERTEAGDFRGPAVQGKRGERFLYLVWVEGPAQTMFRRLKLMLNDVPVAEAIRGDLTLTDAKGGPRCGSLKAPGFTWSVEA